MKRFPVFPVTVRFEVEVTHEEKHADLAEAHRTLVYALVENAIRDTLAEHGYLDGPAPLHIVPTAPEDDPDGPEDPEEAPEPQSRLLAALRGLLEPSDRLNGGG